MRHLVVCCLLALVYLSLTVAQECGNSGGDCAGIVDVSQCTADVVMQCCEKCNTLAGCSNIALNCYIQYSSHDCYNSQVSDKCCQMCRHFKTDFLGPSCLYGDLAAGCNVNSCQSSEAYRTNCCGTCYEGTTPALPTGTVNVETTTTASPNVCEDRINTCPNTVASVPSTCYNSELKDRCCESCANFMADRESQGLNVSVCPYGDRAIYCIEEDFSQDSCNTNDNSYVCCDTCRPENAVCEDSGLISCDLSPSRCYTDDSDFYASQCCVTCRLHIIPEQDYSCRYGDKQEGCDVLIPSGHVCTNDQQAVCCATCQKALITTTPDSCVDVSSSCPLLVGNAPRNCYEVDDACCSTCRNMALPGRPDSCQYGDLISLCSRDLCGSSLAEQCCDTCSDVTTTPVVSTRPPCQDQEQNCMDGIYNLRENSYRCYRSEIRDVCCNTCRQLEERSGDCAWGNREPVCADLSSINCDDEDTRSVCCGECGPPVMSTMRTTLAIPMNCTDDLTTCEDLTEDSIYSCYQGGFLSGRCCASCYRKRRLDLPAECQYGNRITSCNVFIQDNSLCISDENVERDCCETCNAFKATTPAPQPTICPNEWTDATCETLLEQLGGDCSTISEKCCRTCYVTTTSTSTTVPTTTDSCQDVFPAASCATIIAAEGSDQCFTEFVLENCCASCRYFITTSTVAPACPGDALDNCAEVQAILGDQDICEDMSSFRQSCCEYCGDNRSPSTSMATTTLPAGCEGNIWSVALCVATIDTSPLDKPCDSELIGDNCCVYCAMLNQVTTSMTMMTTSSLACAGDDPSINCASLNNQVDVCTNPVFTEACCDFCRPDRTTTAPITTPRTGICSFNVFTQAECQAVIDSSDASKCATNIMIENCCLFCSQLTFPPTTTMPTTPFCAGDNAEIDCEGLDDQFGNNLCTPLVNDGLRQQCCDYCNNLPVSTTTAEPTTSVCMDTLTSGECVALIGSSGCNATFTQDNCCASCALVNAPSSTTSTTTSQTTTTPLCIDDPQVDCFSLISSQGIDPCVGTVVLQQACCNFCSNRTTPAPTTVPTTITPGPCTGDSFPAQLCSERLNIDPDYCTTDSTWLSLCCDFCGAPVITGPTAGPSAPATGAPTVSSSAPSAPTTSTAAECTGNLFSIVLCNNGLQDNPEGCNEESWYSVCCEYCEDLWALPDRRRRSIEGEASDTAVASEVARVKRQTSQCSTENVGTCEAVVYNSNTNPKWLVCTEEFMRTNCCEYCTRFGGSEEAVPEGCWNDTLEQQACQSVIDVEGLGVCSESPVDQLCCLSCALNALRTELSTTQSSPTTTTTPPTTTSPTTTSLECKQEYLNSTCRAILDGGTDCSDPFIVAKCCDFSCIETTSTTVRAGETTTTILTTTTTTTAATITTTMYTDPVPSCGDADFAQTCSRFVYAVPSECYSQLVYRDCCQSCTEYYYERKAGGYNVQMCAYGNRDESCSVVDCNDPADALRCCDVCYPKMDTTTRAVVGSLTSEYAVILAIDTPCLQEFSDPNSFEYGIVSEFVISGVREIFSILPGTQVYTVPAISCNESVPQAPIIVHAVMQTPTTHTFSELLEIYDNATIDSTVGIFTINNTISSFNHQELYDGECKMDDASNCDRYATAPASECYESAAYQRCCVSCNKMARALYADRKYIPAGCQYGDKEMECSGNITCSSAEAQKQCCYTCATEPEDYNQVQTSTTTTETEGTTTQTTTSAVRSTTAPPDCLLDTSDNCHNLTKVIRSCYNKALVYDVCCVSCDSVTLQYLPEECQWGDKEGWCVGITQEQCSDRSIYESCCERCGPHLSTTEPTTTTTIITTTPPCIDQLVNCANLTIDPSYCYRRSNECCETCAALSLDYLPPTCKYGDMQAYCLNIDVDACIDKQYAADCCKTCGPPAPTTTTTTTSTSTSAPTTILPSTTTMLLTTITSDPGCISDTASACAVLTPNGGCYNPDTEESCCLTCASLLDQDAPNNCRYGDHSDYCTSVTRERCLTEARVYTDCCKTCEGLVAPPGVCQDVAANCDVLTADPGSCYSDIIYSQCCEICEDKVKDYLSPTCRWGDLKDLCTFYQQQDCDTIEGLKEECCELCSDIITTTTPPHTTTQPQCTDSPSVNCQQDTAEARYCYNEAVAKDCCVSCRILAAGNKQSCPYGDKEEWCQYFADERSRCSEEYVSSACCELCAPPTTTAGPTTSACYDTSNCTAHISSCYEDRYKAVCCGTCQAAYDLDALYGCAYGDKHVYCQHVTREQCIDLEPVQADCCETCPKLTATTTSEVPPQTTTTTTSSTTTTPPTTQPPQCTDSNVAVCTGVNAEDCYKDNVKDECCSTCQSFERSDAMCLYGDRDASFCSSSAADCSLSVIRTLCCDTCSNFVVPMDVEAIYRLEINVTSLRCTVGLNDRSTAEFASFKYNIQEAVDNILMDLPGIELSELVDIKCGSVFAILEITSVGFYDLAEMNRVIMAALSSGQLQGPQVTYSVSVTGSALRALSFEAPSCVNGDFSLDCLTSFVLTEPSNCYEAHVRTQCCSSCSSLFYARLAAGVDMEFCPYGDRDAECFTQPDINCFIADARSSCCDRCASVTTTPPPTTTTTEPTSTTTTPEPCVDEDSNLCAQGVQNSLTFCYTQEHKCCNTCKNRRIAWLPEDCAWGDKADICSEYDQSSCQSSASINSTCCQLCFNYNVSPTDAPCAVEDDVDFDCTPIQISPSFCYDNDYYSHCCQSCLAVRMNYFPQGCEYGDKADFCDSSNLICSVYGDDLCCASCCSDCQSPSPETTTSTTAVVTTTLYQPPGCVDLVNCADIVKDPSSCYSEQINSSCCLSCYNIRRTDLPGSCSYGDKLTSCSGIMWQNCTEPTDIISDVCCSTCYDLLDVSCNETSSNQASNCEVTAANPGACYSQEGLQKCCRACKHKAVYSLPETCRFGDKVVWCSDITDENKDRICRESDSQQQCCQTCKDYVGITTTLPPSPTTSSTAATTTRLPPNEQCPLGDIASNCAVQTNLIGACYDPAVADGCCRTCYEQWRDDLPNTCRYGDRSPYCISTAEDIVDYDWCLLNEETCCARCQPYLTTTLPTTTLPAQCPNGNIRDDCDSKAENGYDCYSPVREEGCCVQCTNFIRPHLPISCKYGDKAGFCQDITLEECSEHAETCCEKCAASLTTTTATTTTTVILTKSTTSSTLAATTTVPTTTVRPITRVSAVIGRNLFERPVPPGDITLFKLSFNLHEGCSQVDNDLEDAKSLEFKRREQELCLDVSQKMWSVTNCYLETVNCSQSGNLFYTIYILVDKSINYDNIDFNINQLTSELDGSHSQRRRRAISYEDLLVEDVDECEVVIARLADACSDQADCTNSEGSYSCKCQSGLEGDGFSCRTKIDPRIGSAVFSRSVPPGYEYLYQLLLTINYTGQVYHKCFDGMNEPTSTGFSEMQTLICSTLGDALLSLEACYVHDFNCDNKFTVTAHILIDASINYVSKSVSSSIIKNELASYNGEITSDLVQDIDECSTNFEILSDRCHASASCINSPGLYACSCNDGFTGNGFSCHSSSATAQPSQAVYLEDWAIAVIIVGAVILLVALILAFICCCRYNRRMDPGHHQLTAGEDTPPQTEMSGHFNPPLYNSMRSTYAPASDYAESYFFAQQEKELPGYAQKTYNVASHVADTGDTTTFQFD